VLTSVLSAQFRELLLQLSRRPTFDELHQLGGRQLRWCRQQHVDMIRRYRSSHNHHISGLAGLPDQVARTLRQPTAQYPPREICVSAFIGGAVGSSGGTPVGVRDLSVCAGGNRSLLAFDEARLRTIGCLGCPAGSCEDCRAAAGYRTSPRIWPGLRRVHWRA
jgi:hypothetical protein